MTGRKREYVLSTVLAVLIASLLIIRAQARLVSAPGLSDPAPTPTAAGKIKRQLVAVLIGASTCGACRTERFRAAFAAAQGRLVSKDSTVFLVGVALDFDTKAGVKLLTKLAAFDELIVGGNWANHAANKYIWDQFPGMPTIPQMVVLERTVEYSDRGVVVGDEEVLVRLLGTDEIERWASSQAWARD